MYICRSVRYCKFVNAGSEFSIFGSAVTLLGAHRMRVANAIKDKNQTYGRLILNMHTNVVGWISCIRKQSDESRRQS